MLPNACETKMVMTMNLPQLAEFLSLRCCNRAQWEIRASPGQCPSWCCCQHIFASTGPRCLVGPCPEGPYVLRKTNGVRAKYAKLKEAV